MYSQIIPASLVLVLMLDLSLQTVILPFSMPRDFFLDVLVNRSCSDGEVLGREGSVVL